LTYEGGNILGVASVLPEIRDVTLTEGRFFTEQEERASRPVVVIGDDIRAALFPASSAIGGTVKIRGIDFTVIGIQEKIGSTFGRGSSDNPAYVPDSMFTRLFGPGQGFAIFGKARPETGLSLDDALDVSRVALRSRFHQPPNQPDRFDVLTPDSIRSFIDNILTLISAVIVPVTAISLVVGGIVIMNIMLVSVTERTREIGIRKAVGAKRSDIMLQFLIEAVLLASVGGSMGVILGAVLVAIATQVSGVALGISLPYVALAIFVSTTVGVASGWYPASRAAKLDPVVALRAE
jgi:putative ABC transport system permease protein